MTTLTWLGEDDEHPEGQAGPSFTMWKGIKFRIGEAVPVDDPDMIRRARGNRFFSVGDDPVEQPPAVNHYSEHSPVKRGPGRPPKVKSNDSDPHQG